LRSAPVPTRRSPPLRGEIAVHDAGSAEVPAGWSRRGLIKMREKYRSGSVDQVITSVCRLVVRSRMQLYAAIVTAVMAKNQRTNRVFIDWSGHTGLSR
jgi:hypothetical protein